MVMAGGTGGHIFPGLAVAQALRERGADVCWLGADGGMETRLVPPQGVAIDTIAVKGVRGKGIATLLAAPLRILSAVRAAAAVMRARRPDAAVSFGGFAAGPGGIAAKLAGIPLLVHEQNRAAGMTNKALAKVARQVARMCGVAGGSPVGTPPVAAQPPLPADAGNRGTSRLRQRIEPALGRPSTESAALAALRRSR